MAYRSGSVLLDTDVVRVADVACRAPRSAGPEDEIAGVTQVIVPRRGMFSVRSRGGSLVADANTALLLAGGDDYCVTHPVGGGDDCTVFVFAPDVFHQAVGERHPQQAMLAAATQFATSVLTATLRAGVSDVLEAEESCLRVLERLTVDLGAAAAPQGERGHQRSRVEEVRELVASRPADAWQLAQLGQAVHCSPFHLARQFRQITGMSIAAYVLRLRLAIAVDRLAGGETSLSKLAVECGFAHHSHFTQRFRSVFGLAPTTARDLLTRPQLRELRRIVTAPPLNDV